MRVLMTFVFVMFFTTAASAWSVSCGADPGAIKKSWSKITFSPSRNYCGGGSFGQRSEVKKGEFSSKTKGKRIFSSKISLQSSSGQKFTILQLHNNTYGCTPPLTISVDSSNRIVLGSNYTYGPNKCKRVSGLAGKRSGSTGINRKGKPFDFRAEFDFDGTGGFDVAVFINNRRAVSGRYSPDEASRNGKNKRGETLNRYYFKHGVYSKRMFNYTMVSEGAKISRSR